MNQQTGQAVSGVTISGKGERKSDHAVLYGAVSASEPNRLHLVVWEADAAEWQCDCKGFAFRHHCRHVDALGVWLGAQRWSLTLAGAARVAELRQAEKREASVRRESPAFSILK